MKKGFLVVYDYGMGGLWAVINAGSRNEIVQKYPILKVIEKNPDWMTDELYEDIASKNTFDIEDAPPDWLVLAMNEK